MEKKITPACTCCSYTRAQKQSALLFYTLTTLLNVSPPSAQCLIFLPTCELLRRSERLHLLGPVLGQTVPLRFIWGRLNPKLHQVVPFSPFCK